MYMYYFWLTLYLFIRQSFLQIIHQNQFHELAEQVCVKRWSCCQFLGVFFSRCHWLNDSSDVLAVVYKWLLFGCSPPPVSHRPTYKWVPFSAFSEAEVKPALTLVMLIWGWLTAQHFPSRSYGDFRLKTERRRGGEEEGGGGQGGLFQCFCIDIIIWPLWQRC